MAWIAATDGLFGTFRLGFAPWACAVLCCAVLTIDRFEQIFPSGRSSRSVGPGIEIREDPSETMRWERELDDMTSLE